MSSLLEIFTLVIMMRTKYFYLFVNLCIIRSYYISLSISLMSLIPSFSFSLYHFSFFLTLTFFIALVLSHILSLSFSLPLSFSFFSLSFYYQFALINYSLSISEHFIQLYYILVESVPKYLILMLNFTVSIGSSIKSPLHWPAVTHSRPPLNICFDSFLVFFSFYTRGL